MSEPFLAEIVMFGGNFAPRGWAFCDGQLLAISQYSALFSLLGTNFGGDGRTTFGLPDMRGRVSIHPGNGPGLSQYRLGQKGGQENVTLNINEIPTHTHAAALKAEVAPAAESNPNNRMLATSEIYADVNPSNTDRTLASQSIIVTNTGGNQSHNNIQPYLCVNYIIALQGVFPSRN